MSAVAPWRRIASAAAAAVNFGRKTWEPPACVAVRGERRVGGSLLDCWGAWRGKGGVVTPQRNMRTQSTAWALESPPTWKSGAAWRYVSEASYPTVASFAAEAAERAAWERAHAFGSAVVPEVKMRRAAPPGAERRGGGGLARRWAPPALVGARGGRGRSMRRWRCEGRRLRDSRESAANAAGDPEGKHREPRSSAAPGEAGGPGVAEESVHGPESAGRGRRRLGRLSARGGGEGDAADAELGRRVRGEAGGRLCGAVIIFPAGAGRGGARYCREAGRRWGESGGRIARALLAEGHHALHEESKARTEAPTRWSALIASPSLLRAHAHTEGIHSSHPGDTPLPQRRSPQGESGMSAGRRRARQRVLRGTATAPAAAAARRNSRQASVFPAAIATRSPSPTRSSLRRASACGRRGRVQGRAEGV